MVLVVIINSKIFLPVHSILTNGYRCEILRRCPEANLSVEIGNDEFVDSAFFPIKPLEVHVEGLVDFFVVAGYWSVGDETVKAGIDPNLPRESIP